MMHQKKEEKFKTKYNNKYCESRGSKVLTNVKNWNKTRRTIDFPNRQWYGGIS